MEKISEMIERLCPEGVEKARLEDIVRILDSQRKPVSKDARVAGMYPYYGANGIQDYVNEYIFNGTYILLGEDGSVINIDKSPVLHWVSGKIWVNNHAHILESNGNADLRYVYYALTETDVSDIVRGTPPKLNQANLRNIEIPLPPLPIQQEIVRILDSFTQLQSNLEAELVARQKQYEYYRNKLLTFDKDDESVEWKTLGEISVKVCSGGTPSRKNKDYFQGTIPWLRTQEVDWSDVYDTELKITSDAVANSSAKIIPTNCVIIAMYGATAGKSCVNKIPLTTNQACCNLQIDDKISSYKYVYHYVCKEYENIKDMGEGSQNNINAQKVKSYRIPIPSLQRQREIVSILDTFESLIGNLKREIAARKKQYEYYREKLLTF